MTTETAKSHMGAIAQISLAEGTKRAFIKDNECVAVISVGAREGFMCAKPAPWLSGEGFYPLCSQHARAKKRYVARNQRPIHLREDGAALPVCGEPHFAQAWVDSDLDRKTLHEVRAANICKRCRAKAWLGHGRAAPWEVCIYGERNRTECGAFVSVLIRDVLVDALTPEYEDAVRDGYVCLDCLYARMARMRQGGVAMRKAIHRRRYTKNAICGRRGGRLAFAADMWAAIDCADCMEIEAASAAELALYGWLQGLEDAAHAFNAGAADGREGMGDWMVQTCQRCGMYRHIDGHGHVHRPHFGAFAAPIPECEAGRWVE